LPRKKKQDIKINDNTSLEGLLQETYNDACLQISDSQKGINELTSTTNTPANGESNDVDDITKVYKERGNLLKIKDSAIRIKLEVAKLQSDIIKHSGNAEKAINERSGGTASINDFKTIRDLMKKNKEADSTDTEIGG